MSAATSDSTPAYIAATTGGVPCTTLATLLLELSLTRIFSVVFYYHFAFLAISIGLFGLGAGGVFSCVAAGWRGTFFARLGNLALHTSGYVFAALIFLLSREGDLSNWSLGVVYFAVALPFFSAGAVVSLVISETIERVERVYFVDLLGAPAGCLILLPLLNYIGGPNTVLAAATVYAISVAIWYNLDGQGIMRVAARSPLSSSSTPRWRSSTCSST